MLRNTTYRAIVLGLCLAAPAVAQERSFNFALRSGVSATPSYPGSGDIDAGLDLGLSFGALKWSNFQIGNGIGHVPDEGLSFRGAFRVVGDRTVAQSPELAGLQDIDTAYELGLGVVYRQRNWETFGELRRGFGGHEGVTGTWGMDVIARPTERWTLKAGPRVNFGNDRFATTYFGINADQAAASRFDSFEANGGALGAGVEFSATFNFDQKWALEGAVGYERLLNDAADSPITQYGSPDQWRLRLGVSRAITFNF